MKDNQEDNQKIDSKEKSKREIPQTILIEREKIILREGGGFSIKSCLTTGCGLFMAVIVVGVILISTVPEYKEKALTFALSVFAKQYEPNDLPKTTPQYIKPEFLNAITALSSSSNLVEQVRIGKDEFNSYLENTDFGIDVIGKTEFLDRGVKVFVKSKKYTDSPWIKIMFENPANGQLQLKSANLGPFEVSPDSLRSSLKTFNVGLENFNFEKINEYLDQLLLPKDSKFKIEKIDMYSDYALLRLIRK
ncbi:MAG: hypothetical protein WCK31_00155 [bacterium]